MIKLPLNLVRVYEVLFKIRVRNINLPPETVTFDYSSLHIMLIYRAEPWETDCTHEAALLLCDPFLSSKVHRLILSLCLFFFFLMRGGGCEVTALGVRVEAPYLKPQHGRVRRRSTARSTLRGSSVKTYRKASMHRKKPKIISWRGGGNVTQQHLQVKQRLTN